MQLIPTLPEAQAGRLARVSNGDDDDPAPPIDRYFTGKNAETASRRLSDLGLKVDATKQENSDTVPKGRVISQSPRDGTLYRGDTVTLVIEPGRPPWEFRNCASTEGVHATAWSGKPLSSTRRWHAYYYLGYDVEPDCLSADLADFTDVGADNKAKR